MPTKRRRRWHRSILWSGRESEDTKRVAAALEILRVPFPWLNLLKLGAKSIRILASQSVGDGIVAIFRPAAKRRAFYSIAFYSTGSHSRRAHIGAFYRPLDAIEDIEGVSGVKLGKG